MDCAICLESIGTAFFQTGCGHCFHIKCFRHLYRFQHNSFKKQLLCPLCNKRICKYLYSYTSNPNQLMSDNTLPDSTQQNSWCNIVCAVSLACLAVTFFIVFVLKPKV